MYLWQAHWQEKKKGNIQESLTSYTHTGTLPQETGPPKSLTLPCLSSDHRSMGTGHKEGNQLLLNHLSSQS